MRIGCTSKYQCASELPKLSRRHQLFEDTVFGSAWLVSGAIMETGEELRKWERMKERLAAVILTALLLFSTDAEAGKNQVHVRNYSTKSGHLVQQHYRTSPGHNKRENWSSKGNWNPTYRQGGDKGCFREAIAA